MFNKEGYLASTLLSKRTVAYRNSMSSPKKRSVCETSETTVCDVIVIDKTGPVLVSLWGDVIESLEAIVDAHRQQVGSTSSEKPLLLFENLKAVSPLNKSYHGEILTSLNQLQTTRDGQNQALSKVSLLTTPTSACMTEAEFTLPPPSVVVKNLSLIHI